MPNECKVDNDNLVICIDANSCNFGYIFYIHEEVDEGYRTREVYFFTKEKTLYYNGLPSFFKKNKTVRLSDIKTFDDYYNKIFTIKNIRTSQLKTLQRTLTRFYELYKNGNTLIIDGKPTVVQCDFNI